MNNEATNKQNDKVSDNSEEIGFIEDGELIMFSYDELSDYVNRLIN